METAVAGGRGRWGTAIALALVVLLLSIFDSIALVLLPLAVLLVGLPQGRQGRWVLTGLLLWLVALALSGGALAVLSRGWALLLGGLFLAATLARPQWGVTPRALLSVGVASAVGLLGAALTGQWGALESLVAEHFRTVSELTVGDLETRLPDSAWVAELRSGTERIAELQASLFPALLALQSLAALALGAWWVRRLGRSEERAFELAPLREFRFHDQLIWVLIAGLLLVLLPLGPTARQLGVNLLVFMGGLYALRGLAIFVFLASASRSILTMVLAALALVFLYPVALSAALLMGVGDTWLDVRRRAALARTT